MGSSNIVIADTVIKRHGPEMAVQLAEDITSQNPDISVQVCTRPEETKTQLTDASAVIASMVPEYIIEADDVQWIQLTSAGADHLDFDRLSERGITVTTASGIHAQPIAEHVLGYMLYFARDIGRGLENESQSVWRRYTPTELSNQTVGIVGVGAIGSRIAKLTSALGMETIGTKRDTSSAPEYIDEIFPPDKHIDMVQNVDYLVVSCPLTEATEELIDSETISSLPAESVIINVARGAVIEQEALVKSLQSGRLRGAALDVFEEEPLPSSSPLWRLPSVVVTPHIAGASNLKWGRLAALVVKNFDRFRTGESDTLINWKI